MHEILHGLRDVYKPATVWHFKPEVFSKMFHGTDMPRFALSSNDRR
jgi:hypothetical protein